MGLRDLADSGVPDLLDAAAEIIGRHGLAKGLRYDPANQSVDLVGALAVAAGQKPDQLMSSVSLLDLGVPPVMEARLHLCMDVLDAFCPEVETWADLPTVTSLDVQNLLRKAAMRLRIAVV
jgi:hypothetical protein